MDRIKQGHQVHIMYVLRVRAMYIYFANAVLSFIVTSSSCCPAPEMGLSAANSCLQFWFVLLVMNHPEQSTTMVVKVSVELPAAYPNVRCHST
ncbi:hypothetical protein IF1G_02385 [Cordyceps javanica]|uniref:Uncharacterized protein n=1 Tax=Cordyceps javanica TaxID=43265 RepID=A0A545V9A7_9HYPO|nr:hypothetical protein IF1G_02385 [Cordyceps javanica]